MSSSKATIKDIAKALGVSVATVSRALNGSHEIHPLTKEKVLAKAKERMQGYLNALAAYDVPVETIILDAKLNIRNSTLPLSKRVR